MNKLIILLAISFSLIYCSKSEEEKYFVEILIQDNSKISSGKKKNVEEILANNPAEAYSKAYTSFYISQISNDDINTDDYSVKTLSFRLLDKNKNDITKLISNKKKDSIKKVISKQVKQIDSEIENYVPETKSKEEVKAMFSPLNGSLPSFVDYVKANMHNPSSFDHEETSWKDDKDGIIVKMKYRGENGFGALRLQESIAKFDYDGNFIRLIK